jgi:hypothetical protein
MNYPPRPKGSDVERFGYRCICSHYWHNHKVGFLLMSNTNCEECMCPKYRADKTLDENNKPVNIKSKKEEE